MMKKHFLATLAAGLVASAAAPALAGEITFEGLTLADGNPAVASTSELPAGNALGTILDVSFSGLFADRDDGPTDSGEYEGFAAYFPSDTVAINLSLGIVSTPITGGGSTTRYGQLADVTDVNSAPCFSFAAGQNSVSFDFIANFGTQLTVELWKYGEAAASASQTFDARFDAQSMPEINPVAMSSTQSFDRVQLRITGAEPHYFAMDNLRFGVAVVPLPPAAFMGLGLLAGVGIVRRLRRRSA